MSDNFESKNIDSLEQMLRAVRPVAPTNVEATFYQAGFAAAMQQREMATSVAPARRWPTFSVGLLSGVAASVMAAIIWVQATIDTLDDVRGIASRPALTAIPVSVPDLARDVPNVVPTIAKAPERLPFDLISWIAHLSGDSQNGQPIRKSQTAFTSRFVGIGDPQMPLVLNPAAFNDSQNNESTVREPVLKNRPMNSDSITDLL